MVSGMLRLLLREGRNYRSNPDFQTLFLYLFLLYPQREDKLRARDKNACYLPGRPDLSRLKSRKLVNFQSSVSLVC